MKRRIAVVGAGFSGAVIARTLADTGAFVVDVFESRAHLGGNCHTIRDSESNVLVHEYGPHIFHTNDEEVWRYVNRFGCMRPFVNRVKAISGGRVYGLPVNLHTINQLFGTCLGPEEAREFIARQAVRFPQEPANFEEQALSLVGRDVYEALFRGYTKKQWGRDPRELPASILKRLPLRFNYDDNYYSSRFQGIPEAGYTPMVSRILEHSAIATHLNERFFAADESGFEHVFYSGPVDAYFGHCLGRLRYRSLRFQRFVSAGDYQGNAVINYSDEAVPFTRVTEHAHFAPWESHERSVCFREFSFETTSTDEPFYPLRLEADTALLTQYQALAKRQSPTVTFVGRLGTYRYLDMHVVIREALDTARAFVSTGVSASRGL